MRRLTAVSLIVLLLCVVGYVAAISNPLTAPTWSARVREPQVTKVSERTVELITKMRNEDVSWGISSVVGVRPAQLQGATLLLRDNEEDITSLLIDALADKDRFVAAHVLLRLRQEAKLAKEIKDATTPGKPPPVTVVMTVEEREEMVGWYGLKVQFLADGTFAYEGNDLSHLQEMWKEWLHLKVK